MGHSGNHFAARSHTVDNPKLSSEYIYIYSDERPFHQMSTCLAQSTSGPCVVHSWSRYGPNSDPPKAAYSTEWWVRVFCSTQGPSWGYPKVNSSGTLSFFRNKCPHNSSKNDLMVPRTAMECPHEGPRVGPAQLFFLHGELSLSLKGAQDLSL